MTIKVLKCRKCGAGENNAFLDHGIMIGKSGGATLIKQAANQYICTDCCSIRPMRRRIRRQEGRGRSHG